MPACTSCGAQLEETARFCVACGAAIAAEADGNGNGAAGSPADGAVADGAVADGDIALPPPPPPPPMPEVTAVSPPIAELTLQVPGFATHSDLAERVSRMPTIHPAATSTLTAERPEPEPADVPDEPPTRRVRRVVIGAVAAAAVVIAAVVTTSVVGGDEEPAASGPREIDLAVDANVVVPAVAPDGADNAGNPVNYRAANLTDGDPTTAWRMPGRGTGEDVVLSWPQAHTVTEVGLVNGYAKTDDVGDDDRYRQNRRVLEVTWSFDDGTEVTQELAETPEPQMLTLDEPVSTFAVKIHIERVSRSGGRDFTALGEVAIIGSD
ncbi:MAG TPA: zinc-ribbon domain-containing protein [Jiangellaceae bacterium]